MGCLHASSRCHSVRCSCLPRGARGMSINYSDAMSMRLRVLFCVTAAQALTIPSLTSRFAAAPPALTRLEQLQARLSQGAATTAAVGATCLALTLAMPDTACAAMISQEAGVRIMNFLESEPCKTTTTARTCSGSSGWPQGKQNPANLAPSTTLA